MLQDEHVLLMDRFPSMAEIVQLPRLPVALALPVPAAAQQAAGKSAEAGAGPPPGVSSAGDKAQ
jgi:hypothetical protein